MNLFRFFLMFWLKRDVGYERSGQHRGLRPSSWEVVARITNSPWILKNDEMAQNVAFSFSLGFFSRFRKIPASSWDFTGETVSFSKSFF